MNFFCIASCVFLIAAVRAQYSEDNINLDDPNHFYIDNPEDNTATDENNLEDFSPPPTIISKSETVVVKEGENAALHCKVENLGNHVIMWKKGEELISQGSYVYTPNSYKVLEDNSLLVINVKPSLTGQYSCEILISLPIKPILTHRLKLENDVEIVSLKAKNNITQLYPGDKLTLTCEVDGNPLPTIKWYFDGDDQSSVIKGQNNKVQSSERSDTLVIEKVDIKNNGTYQCRAENQKNSDQKSIVIEVFDKGRDVASHTDSRVSRGLQLAPSLIVLLTTMMLMNP